MKKQSSSRFAFFYARLSIGFVLLVCIQLNARAAWTPPPPDMQSWFTGDETVNDHIWQRVGTLYNGATSATAKVAAPSESRQLYFEDRVAYQRAIEEVYWRHRIWPKERPDRKPSLDAVMSQATIEQKVQDYLRSSEMLEQDWQKPITPEQLQAEMERMAQHSKQPEVLRELFAALGNDPFVIAECLARPVLSERLQFAAVESRKELLESWSAWGARAQDQMANVMAAATVNYALPAISDQPSECIDDTWTATTTTNAPTGRSSHTAVWTGTEMIVWGGYDGVNYFNTGGRYNPSTDSWTATSTTNAPTGRYSHTAVWTGSEMIVWGGFNGSYLNTGGRYNPGTDSWMATCTTNAPSGRYSHTAVLAGSEMIVWGGYDGSSYLNTGGRYNPGTDCWTATSTTNAPSGRYLHTAVWTNSEMIIWAGRNENLLITGGRYNPSTDSWTATSTTSAPVARVNHRAVWAGSEMIVWGGVDPDAELLNTGGRYNPGTDSWIATTTNNAPSARFRHTAVWTGSEMIVWGGSDDNFIPLNTGGRYNPGTDSWTATTTTNAPTARTVHTAVWTDSEMIVWGGFDNTGGRYCAQAGSPTTLVSAASVKGLFAIDLPLSGLSGVEDRGTSRNGRYLIVMTFNNEITSASNATVSCGPDGTATATIDPADAHKVNVVLVGVKKRCSESDVVITADVSDGTDSITASATMGLLIGDVNGDRVVDAADVQLARSYRGQTTDGTNFRADINDNGRIESSDVGLVKENQGDSL